MATIKVVDVLSQVEYMLTDPGAIRWPKRELLKWFNEAQRALVSRRPDSLAVTQTFNCVAGPLQNIPAQGIRLIEAVRNIGGKKESITRVKRKHLDSNIPDWYGHTQESNIKHFIYDERVPKQFYVYPPASAGAQIEIAYSQSPQNIVIADADFDTDDQTISVDDVWSNALQEYILYRAWMKDSESAGNTNRASMHFNQFRLAIGEITEADAGMAGRTSG